MQTNSDDKKEFSGKSSSSTTLVVALIVIVVLLALVASSEYQQLHTTASPTYHPHYVKLLNTTQVSIVFFGNTSGPALSNVDYNYSTDVGTYQWTQFLIGRAYLEGIIQVWGYNVSSYSNSEYAILPSFGSSIAGPQAGNNLTLLTSGTFSGNWQYKVLDDGLCKNNETVAPNSVCDIVGIAVHSPYVIYAELYAYPGETISQGVSPVPGDANTTAITDILNTQALQTR